MDINEIDKTLQALEGKVVWQLCNVGPGHDGWTYVAHHDDYDSQDKLTKIQHFAVNGSEVIEMDFTPYHPMPALVFKWMVDLQFPTRKEVGAASLFPSNQIGPLHSRDVERLWLWSNQKPEVAA